MLVLHRVSCWESVSYSYFLTFFFKFQTLLPSSCSQLMTFLFHWERKKQSEQDFLSFLPPSHICPSVLCLSSLPDQLCLLCSKHSPPLVLWTLFSFCLTQSFLLKYSISLLHEFFHFCWIFLSVYKLVVKTLTWKKKPKSSFDSHLLTLIPSPFLYFFCSKFPRKFV